MSLLRQHTAQYSVDPAVPDVDSDTARSPCRSAYFARSAASAAGEMEATDQDMAEMAGDSDD